MPDQALRICPLGGVGEVGKNSTLLEWADHLLLIDAGVKFPEASLHGIDLVIPDFTYVTKRADDLLGVLVTHGHEDHIGALPYLLMQLERAEPTPIYATRLTLGLISVKLKEHGVLDKASLREIADPHSFTIGPFTVRPIAVNHSVPDAVGFALRTPVGLIFHTGDFKFDPTPVDGRTTDVGALRSLGDEGVLVLLSDCVRVEQPGWTPSESIVQQSLEQIIREALGRVIITTFASNIGRLHQVINSSARLGRRVAVAGRSMEENLKVARELGFLDVPEDTLIELRASQALPPRELTLLTTGSQGEPTSVISRMGMGEYQAIKIRPDDTVVFSATPVPGNEEEVARSIDNLFRQGARVIYRATNPLVHVSGHASQEELKHMIHLVRPRFCVPLHGEYRMLVLYRDLAAQAGVEPDRVLITEIGEVLKFQDDSVQRNSRLPSGSVLVDGLNVGGVSRLVLRDRSRLAADGVLMVAVAVDRETGELLGRPDLVARGFAVPPGSDFLEQARDRVQATLEQRLRVTPENGWIIQKVRETLSPFVYEQTRQRPMILTAVTEV